MQGMRTILAILSALLLAALSLGAAAQNAPDMFKDVPKDHWAYQAVEPLRARGILAGYPDGYFRGQRILTRYEFAVALDRALQRLLFQRTANTPEPAAALTIDLSELAQLRRLVSEFRSDLVALGNKMEAVDRGMDLLAKSISERSEKRSTGLSIMSPATTPGHAESPHLSGQQNRLSAPSTLSVSSRAFPLRLDTSLSGAGSAGILN